MRAAIYTRVSTAHQAEEDKVSLAFQLADIEAYCESKGYTIVGERPYYQDPGFSGASKRRPAFQRMLKDAQQGLFDVIVAWKSDRLSRGMYPAALLMEAIEGTDITIEAVKDTIDLNTFGLLAAVGKIELDNIRERARMGAKGRASKGKIAGVAKYGYAIGQDSKPVIVDEEAVNVRRMFAEYIGGQGCRSIVRGLSGDGILTRNRNEWSASRVWDIISNPAYVGRGVFGRKRYFMKDDGERAVKHSKTMPQDTWTTVEYPRIIDDATYEKAQHERKNPSRQSYRKDRRHQASYLLRGMLWWGHCGKRYTTQASYQVQYRTKKDGIKVRIPTDQLRTKYVCTRGIRPNTDCPTTYIYGKAIEPIVWKAVVDFLTNPEEVKALINAREHDLRDGGMMAELGKARGQMEAVESEKGRAFQLFQKGYVSEGELDIRMKGITEPLEFFGDEVYRLETEASQIATALEYLQDLMTVSAEITSRLDTMTDEDKAEVMRNIVDHVTVEDKGQFQVVLALEPVYDQLPRLGFWRRSLWGGPDAH